MPRNSQTRMKCPCLEGQIYKALHFHDKVVAKRFHLNHGSLINGVRKMEETRAVVQLLRGIRGKLVKLNVVMYNTYIDTLCNDKLIYN